MGFFDLNIPYTDSTPLNKASSAAGTAKSTRIKIVVKAMELGYTGIAYNRTIKGVMSDRDRCSIPLLTLSSLLKIAPFLSSSVNLHRDLLGVPRSSPFRQYTRLTVCIDNASQSQALNSGNPVLKTYDIVAVRPLNQNAFDHSCEKAEVDIISIDFSDKVPFRLKLPMIKAAIKRGVYFEITYSDLIVDVHLRRQMISNAKLLVDWTRGKNLIFSSAAPSVCEVRGPNDVANLASLFGLSIERAKLAISKNCRSLLASALRRKHFFKEVIRVEAVSSSGKPWSVDRLNWDPISSGEGDLMFEDITKSFSSCSDTTVKAIDFDSVINNMPSGGFQVKDLISGTKAACQSLEKDKKTLSTTEPVDLSIAINQVFEKTSKIYLLPQTEMASLDGRPSEEPTSLFGDSHKSYSFGSATKTSTDSKDVVSNISSTEEEPETHNGSGIVVASIETESRDLQSDDCIPEDEQNVTSCAENVRIDASSDELNSVTNEIVVSQALAMDIELDAACNDGNELNAVMPNENATAQMSSMDIEEDPACNAACNSSPSEGNFLPPSKTNDTYISKRSPIDTGEKTNKMDDVAVDIHMDVEHKENMSVSLNNVSMLEKVSEGLSSRGPEDDGGITDQISFERSDDGMGVRDDLVANHENLMESTEEQKLDKGDLNANDPASILSNESLDETVLEKEPTKVVGDDGSLLCWNPIPESNEEMKAKDIFSTADYCIQEGASGGQSGEHKSSVHDLTSVQQISVKSRARRRNLHQGFLFPLRRNLYPASFKRKTRKKSQGRLKMA